MHICPAAKQHKETSADQVQLLQIPDRPSDMVVFGGTMLRLLFTPLHIHQITQNKACPARTQLIMSWKALLSLSALLVVSTKVNIVKFIFFFVINYQYRYYFYAVSMLLSQVPPSKQQPWLHSCASLPVPSSPWSLAHLSHHMQVLHT